MYKPNTQKPKTPIERYADNVKNMWENLNKKIHFNRHNSYVAILTLFSGCLISLFLFLLLLGLCIKFVLFIITF